MKQVTIDVLQHVYLSEGDCKKLDDETLFLEKNYYFGRGTQHLLNDLTSKLNAYPEIEVPVLATKRLYPTKREEVSVYWFSKQNDCHLLSVNIEEQNNKLEFCIKLCEQTATSFFAHDYPTDHISEYDLDYIHEIIAPYLKQCVLESNRYRLRYVTGEIS